MTIDPKNKLRLHHIVEAADHIADFIGGVTKEAFEADYEKQSAVIRQFEIIGEAANKLSSEFTSQHPEVDWPKVVGMRHKMIHDYFNVDVDIVWTTALDDIPALRESVDRIVSAG